MHGGSSPGEKLIVASLPHSLNSSHSPHSSRSSADVLSMAILGARDKVVATSGGGTKQGKRRKQTEVYQLV